MERSAGAVIRNPEGKYLLIRGRSGFWGIPKGHVEPGERDEDAAQREAFEEAGIRIRILDVPCERIVYAMSGGGRKQATYFLAETEGEVRANEEVREFAWLSRDEAMRTLSFGDARRAFGRLSERQFRENA